MLFLTVFFTIPVENENGKLKLALAIPTGAPITVANDAIEILPLLTIKQLKINQDSNRNQYIY